MASSNFFLNPLNANLLLPFYKNVSGFASEDQYPLSSLILVLEGFWPPVLIGLLYIFVVCLWNAKLPSAKSSVKGPSGSLGHPKLQKTSIKAIDLFAFVHNVVLGVFSFCCFKNLFFPLVNHLSHGDNNTAHSQRYPTLKQRFCDQHNIFWKTHLGYWAWLFYLSKYYELVDTFIILIKGRRSSLLQIYHHFGVILCLHVGFYSKTSTLAYFISFNSFIHTIMYTYYALTSLGIRLRIRPFITSLQITQLVCGISIGIGALSAHYSTGGNCLKNNRDCYALVYNLMYLAPLLNLFFQFFRKSYLGSKEKLTHLDCTPTAKSDVKAKIL